jgi:hypothetical protein
MKICDMRLLILQLKKNNPEFNEYIDTSVYSNGRLFRLPLNGKFISKDEMKDNKNINESDIHKFIYGEMKYSIIQDVTDLDRLENIDKLINLTAEDIKKYKSKDYTKNKDIKKINRDISKMFSEIKYYNQKIENLTNTLDVLIKTLNNKIDK